jgi:ATP-dependent DNA ligase
LNASRYVSARDGRSPGLPSVSALVARFGNGCLLLSETFTDADKLLAECERLGIEDIVSKRRDAPYRSGTKSDWTK